MIRRHTVLTSKTKPSHFCSLCRLPNEKAFSQKLVVKVMASDPVKSVANRCYIMYDVDSQLGYFNGGYLTSNRSSVARVPFREQSMFIFITANCRGISQSSWSYFSPTPLSQENTVRRLLGIQHDWPFICYIQTIYKGLLKLKVRPILSCFSGWKISLVLVPSNFPARLWACHRYQNTFNLSAN